MQPTRLTWTRRLALWEGWSYLLLLGVAMPLKYGAGLEAAVLVTGWAHGLLFIAVWAAALLCRVRGWLDTGRTVLLLVATLLPAGPFFLDRRIFGPTDPETPATLGPHGA